MSFNIIDKSMISGNKIILNPDVNFIFASDSCLNLELHDLTTSGTYGTILRHQRVALFQLSNAQPMHGSLALLLVDDL